MSKYADEGTAAHALAAMCLRENKDAAAFIGRVLELEDYQHSKLAPSAAHRWMLCLGSVVLETAVPFKPRKFTWEVTDDMAEDVQVYLDNIRRYADGNVMLIESHLDLSHVLGPEQGGTGDVVIVAGDELQVHDLKFGRGVDVSAFENKQLRLYGLGALPLAEMLGDIKRFRGVIHQPRTQRAPKEWDCSIDELRAFAETAKAVVKGINHVLAIPYERVSEIEQYLVPGDEQCTFCKAAATCPKLTREISHSVFDSFEVIGNPHETATPRAVPTDARALGAYMAKLDMIESWCTAIRAAVEGKLLEGVDVPGFKLVAGRKGARKWGDEAAAETALKKMRLKQDEMYSFKLITPPQAETLLKKENPKRWATLQPLITQADGKPHVAPASDSRPPLPKVADGFEVIKNNEDLA